MASIFDQLDADSVLLLYLSGELDPQDYAEVERRLRQEPALVEALERIREMNWLCQSALNNEDAATRLPMGSDTAVRRVSRAMKQWQVDRLTKKPSPIGLKRRYRLPWWLYGTGIAAAMIVAVIIWSAVLPDASEPFLTQEQIALRQEQLARQLEEDWQEGLDRDWESQQVLATRELDASTEADLRDVFFRSGG